MNNKVSAWRQLAGLLLTPFGIFIFIPLAMVIIWVCDKVVK